MAFLCLGAAAVTQPQDGLPERLDRLLDSSPYYRTTWGIYVTDRSGRTLYERNADRLFIPASSIKLVVAAAASSLLPPDHRIVTDVYGTGPIRDGVLHGDLVIYGRGDPTFSERCYGIDTVASGACDDLWTRIDALTDRIVHHGIRQVEGGIVGDGSFFERELVHPAWESYDLNWWYAAPVSGLGFNDNSVNVTWGPGPRVRAPPRVEFEPLLGNFAFANRARTVSRRGHRTIDFFREPGTMRIWAEGTVPLGDPGKTEYFALPDPNLYFVQALRAALRGRGVSIAGSTSSTTDSLRYRELRMKSALAEFVSRSLADRIFPILNSSQNWFAEMLVKTLGREIAGEGSWEAGLEVQRRFLVDSVGIDSTAFELDDASGLSSRNLVTPRALAQLLRYMHQHPRKEAFSQALPRSGARGSLQDRFINTPLAGRVVAKTGSINHVSSLSGYIERPGRSPLIFSVLANNHAVSSARAIRQIDAVVMEIGRQQ